MSIEKIHELNANVNEVTLRNMTNDEIVNYFESTSDPILKEVINRLNKLNLDYESLKEKLNELVDEL